MSNSQNDEFDEAMAEAEGEGQAEIADVEFEKAMEWKEKEDKKELPEAPVSITVKGYYQGFSVLITKRNATGQVELEKIMKAIDNMVEKGFQPSWNSDTNKKMASPAKEPVKDDLTVMCQVHKVPMEQRNWTNPQGEVKTWWSHSKNEDGTWFNCSGKGWKENIKK